MQAGITGLGCICAAGDSLDEIMPALYSANRNPAPSKRVEAGLENLPPVFEIASDLNHINPGNDETRTTLLLLSAVNEALSQSGLEADYLKKKRVGVVIGTTVGSTLNNEPFYRAYRAGKFPDMQPIKRYLTNNPALYIANRYQWDGPAVTIANACSSGTDAVGMAKSWLRGGLCDIVIAGGSDELCRTTYLGFNSLLNTSPEPCRPFDKFRKGLNLGEGAGILIIEKERSAQERGAKILAFVAGYASSGDAYHPTGPHPEGAGLSRAINIALQEANARPEQISFINAHGTSTVDNDKVEGKVIEQIFSDKVPFVSTKAYTGHTLGAAGGIEAVLSVRALLDGQIPATAGFKDFDEECKVAPTTNNTPIKGNMAMSNSLAFGGNNSVLILKAGQ
ncbi:MAG: beta-ketoacyl-[acyl-carrier-protein] synthase family protein [Proteobacteria bacterium]|nr:beta-ketoacyl-[acyl-carrier-protein] synthase family protein [Pseudomonadota bacterium]